MRRILVIGIAGAVALATAGLAAGFLKATGTDPVAASFTATSISDLRTRTCTGSDGTYEIAHARYTGTAVSSNTDLAGPVVLHVKSVYNTTKKLGWVEGFIRVKDTEDRRNGHGRFVAVNTNGGLDGFVTGRVNRHYAAIIGSLAGAFTTSGGFTSGQIGGNGSTANTAIVAGRPCDGRKPGIPVRLTVKGAVDALSATSISVKPFDGSASQSCAIGQGSPSTTGLLGKNVEMHCGQVNGALTLLKIKVRGDR